MVTSVKKVFSLFLTLCVLLTQTAFTKVAMADTQSAPQTSSASQEGTGGRQTVVSAKFNGLTQIVAKTNCNLSGITAGDIVITKSDKSVVPAEKIKSIKTGKDTLTVEIDPDQFARTSSIGTKINTKAFGSIEKGAEVDVEQSGDPLTADVWNKITVSSPGDVSMWHNLTDQTTVHADKTPYKVISNGPIYKQNGKVKALMVVIDFPDAKAADNTGSNGLPGAKLVNNGNTVHGHVLKTAEDYYDYLMPRAKDFFYTASYGQLNFDVTLVQNPKAADGVFTCNGLLYGKNKGNNNIPYAFDRGGDVNRYLEDGLGAAKPVLSNYPGGPYDIIYAVAVENAPGISYGPTDTWGDNANKWTGRTDLKSLVRIGYDSYSAWKFKAVNHETGHDLGLVDYYINGFSGSGGGQCDPNTATADYYPMVGHWNIMGFINGPAPDYLAWDKWRFGWIRDDQVDIITNKGTTTHQITPVETPGGTKMIVIPGPSKGIAYIAEYRQIAGVDNTAAAEKSSDPDLYNQNSNWKHTYGTFNSPGILMYKVDFNVPTLNGPLTVVDLYPENTTKELGTLLDSSVLGSTSGIYSYTDPAAGVTIKLDKETETVDTLTVTNNPPAAAIKPILSDARFVDFNTIEFKTSTDLRGIYKDHIKVRKGASVINGIQINQITPRTIRVTYTPGQFTSPDDTTGVTVSTSAFSYFGASDASPVSPLKNLPVPVLSEAKFNSLTEIQAKSNIDLTGIGAANIVIKKGDSSIVGPDKLTNVSFDAASKTLTVKINTDQFTDNDKTIGTTIATSQFSDYKRSGLNLSAAKYNPPVKVVDSSAAYLVNPLDVKLQSIAITKAANRTIYAVGDQLDINGMVVTGTYDNGSKHIIPIITKDNITNFDSSAPNDKLALTVKVGECTASYDVAVKEKSKFELQSIKIASPAVKTEYVLGEKLDISGLVVKGIYSGDIEQVLTITPADITGFDSTKLSDSQALTITYQGKTASYNIKTKVVSENAYYRFLNKATRKIIESDTGNIMQWWDYSNGGAEPTPEWRFIDQKNGYYKIINKASLDLGYMEIKDGSKADKATTEFSAKPASDGRDLWSVEEVADGYYKIINKNSGKALEIFDGDMKDGAEVGQSTYTGDDNQLWSLTPLEKLSSDK